LQKVIKIQSLKDSSVDKTIFLPQTFMDQIFAGASSETRGNFAKNANLTNQCSR